MQTKIAEIETIHIINVIDLTKSERDIVIGIIEIEKV
jgi:hypothetical protein